MPHKDPERRRAYLAAQYLANRKERLAEDARRYQVDPAKMKARVSAWRKANPGKNRTNHASRRARKKEAFVEKVDYEAVFVRDGGVCQICDSFIGTAKWHIDHRIPLSNGGLHSYANCQLAHATCNLVKYTK